MRTKTLLLAAAAIAAGVISSQAQSNVYSANVVGYYHITVPGSQFAMIANQLPVNGTDNDINNVLTNGVADGSVLFIWGGTGYTPYTYFLGFGWYDADFNLVSLPLAPGKGAFFQNGDSAQATITFVGQVPQGSFTNTVASGFDVYSIPSTISTNLDSTLVNFPANDGDVYFQWNKATQAFNNPYTFYVGFGWFDADFNQVYPAPQVGEGFFLQHSGASSPWIMNFTVQ